MNKTEVAKLLTMASAIDNRTVGTETVEAWYIVVGDLEFEDATTAVFNHFRTSDEYLTPHRVVVGVEQIVNDRKRAHRQLEIELFLLVRDEGADREELLKSERFQSLKLESNHE